MKHSASAARRAVAHERPTWWFGEPKVLVIPAEAHTFDGFIDWVMSDALPEKLRVTLFGGQITLDMSEQALESHVGVKSAVYATLLRIAAEEDFGEFYVAGVLLCNESARFAHNPDGVAFKWAAFEAGRVRFLTRDGEERAVEGSPDWVMEVVDDSSIEHDTRTLRQAYHEAKIPEYWLIDARGRTTVFQILLWRKNGYVAAPGNGGWNSSKVFGREFRLTRKRDRIGHWDYTLEARGENTQTRTRKQS